MATLYPQGSKLLALLLQLVFCCCTFTWHSSDAALVVPLVDRGPNNGAAIGDWSEWLRLQRQFYDSSSNFMDKIPNQVPKFSSGKSTITVKRDEKRRDFEHGWEQCEFSPISCMLRRKR